jgi:hypothetical protein
MPGPIYQVGAVAMCPHGGQITVASSDARVMVGSAPAVLVSDMGVVAGCAFTVPPGKPQPCATVQFLVPATRVTVMGQPVLLQTSSGLCLSADGIPAGPPIIATTQVRVVAT